MGCCVSPRARAAYAGFLQLVLGLGLISLHVFCEMKIIKETQVYGPLFRAVARPGSIEPYSSYQTYHIAGLILAVAMVIFTLLFFVGLYKGRSDYICAWIAMNWVLVFGYAVLLLYSWKLWIAGFLIENIIVLCVTINFICCVNSLYNEITIK